MSVPVKDSDHFMVYRGGKIRINPKNERIRQELIATISRLIDQDLKNRPGPMPCRVKPRGH
ncbi:MAG: hypothetical protein IJ228_13125 [Succinivibrio sp.]|nr:hypothetical protein [Succinivibrio sp.]